jgi:phosphatidylglycerol---prolipoprotein diacylglyceryl transferase
MVVSVFSPKIANPEQSGNLEISFMYPNLYYAFRDLFGVDWKFLRFINSFGFFVALSFIGAAITLTMELRRKEAQGLLQGRDESIVVGKPASISELLVNFIIGFVVGYKFIGLFISSSPLTANPQDFVMSSEGSWPAGLVLGLFFAGLKWWEKQKQRLPEPEQRKIRIWPHDRVPDMAVLAAMFGFLGAKIFNSLENWGDFIKNPIESLFSFSGLTFYGGLICAALAIWYYASKRNIGFWYLNDAAAPGLMLAYGMGRIGCQVSGDGDWGIINSAYQTTPDQKLILAQKSFELSVAHNSDFYSSQFGTLNPPHLSVQAPSFLPDWLFAYPYPHNVINEGLRIPQCSEQYCSYLPLPVFPTPIYETVVCLILFALIWSLRKRFTVPGTLFAFYLVLNGIERFFIEKIRVNTKYNIWGFHPTQAEIISFLLVITGSLLWIYLRKKKAGHGKALAE